MSRSTQRFSVQVSETQISKQDASREFQLARNAARRNTAEHYNELPIWGFSTGTNGGRAIKTRRKGWNK